MSSDDDDDDSSRKAVKDKMVLKLERKCCKSPKLKMKVVYPVRKFSFILLLLLLLYFYRQQKFARCMRNIIPLQYRILPQKFRQNESRQK